MCKKNCLMCQFFVKTVVTVLCRTVSPTVMDEEDRKMNIDALIKKYSCVSPNGEVTGYLFCYRGCWDESVWEKNHKRNKALLKKTIIINRNDANSSSGNSCFYRKFQPEILLPAAEELEKRETIQKEAAADRRWIKVGAWATFATAVATFAAVAATLVVGLLTTHCSTETQPNNTIQNNSEILIYRAPD